MRRLWRGATIFDGTALHEGCVLSTVGDRVAAIAPDTGQRADFEVDLPGGILCAGFIDLQVNGGGGALLGQGKPADALRQILEAHRGLGATGILPTLITADASTTCAVLEAATQIDDPAFLGLHLEGPHLDPRRCGAHDPALIRAMTEADLDLYCAAARRLPALLITLAPESASPDQIRTLVQSGVRVSLGHSDATLDEARAAMAAGADIVTHLFNAMSPLTHRAPGLVGAALDGDCWIGIIPDGVHVDAAAFRIAHRAAQGRMFAVSDAMAVAGSEHTSFTLNGRLIQRADGRLTLADGTLAGADIDLAGALRWMVTQADLPLTEALAMTSALPARVLGLADRGHLSPGARADFVHLGVDFALRDVWQGGTRIKRG